MSFCSARGSITLSPAMTSTGPAEPRATSRRAPCLAACPVPSCSSWYTNSTSGNAGRTVSLTDSARWPTTRMVGSKWKHPWDSNRRTMAGRPPIGAQTFGVRRASIRRLLSGAENEIAAIADSGSGSPIAENPASHLRSDETSLSSADRVRAQPRRVGVHSLSFVVVRTHMRYAILVYRAGREWVLASLIGRTRRLSGSLVACFRGILSEAGRAVWFFYGLMVEVSRVLADHGRILGGLRPARRGYRLNWQWPLKATRV